MDAPEKHHGDHKDQPSGVLGPELLTSLLVPGVVGGGKVVWNHLNKDGPLLIQVIDSKELGDNRYVIALKVTNIGPNSTYIEEATLESSSIMEMAPPNEQSSKEFKIVEGAISLNNTSPERIGPTESKDFVLEFILKAGPSLRDARSLEGKFKTVEVYVAYHDLCVDKTKRIRIKVALRFNKSEGPV